MKSCRILRPSADPKGLLQPLRKVIFSAWEQPQPFSEKVRAAFRPLPEVDPELGAHKVGALLPAQTRRQRFQSPEKDLT
jgi:hypothetical protein